MPFVKNNETDLQQCNVIRSDDASIYGCSSMIINHFQQNDNFKSHNCLSSADLLKFKIKQLD